jgi:hypothetical protein
MNLCSERSSPEPTSPNEQQRTFRAFMSVHINTLASAADESYAKIIGLHAKELDSVKTECAKLVEELKSTQLALAKACADIGGYRRVFKTLILNATHEICNACGADLAGDGIFILNLCGAVRFYRSSFDLQILTPFSRAVEFVSNRATRTARSTSISVNNLSIGSTAVPVWCVMRMIHERCLIC